MTQSSENLSPMAEIKRVMILAHWVAAAGNRRAAAKALNLGYTNVVESLREYGITERFPDLDQQAAAAKGIQGIRTMIDQLEDEVTACEFDTQ